MLVLAEPATFRRSPAVRRPIVRTIPPNPCGPMASVTGSLPRVTKQPKLDMGNLTDDILDRLPAHAGDVALSREIDGGWHDVTLGQFHLDVVAAAKGLVAAGVSPGDRVVLLSKTRYEWTVCDYAIWWAGAVTVPVYETSSAA